MRNAFKLDHARVSLQIRDEKTIFGLWLVLSRRDFIVLSTGAILEVLYAWKIFQRPYFEMEKMCLFIYSSLADPYLLIKCYASLQITESDLIKIVMLMFKAVLHGNFATFPPWVLYYCKKENIMGLLAGLHWFLFENTSIAEFNSWKPLKTFRITVNEK